MNPLLEFESWLKNFGDVERLEYFSERKLVQGEMETVTTLVITFDGVGLYSLNHIEGVNAIKVSTLAVHPSEQGKGIGKRMLKLVCSFADRYGYAIQAVAQLLRLNGSGFTKESYSKLTDRIGSPIHDLKRDGIWRQYLINNFNFVPAGKNTEIIRFAKKRQ